MSANSPQGAESLPAELVELAAHMTGVLEQLYGGDVRLALVFAYRDGPGHTCVRRLANCEFPTALKLYRYAANMPPSNIAVCEVS